MGLSSAWVQSPNRIPELFRRIRDGQAPERFTQQLLKDWGFRSTNDRPFIPLLKSLGFLNSDGAPLERYHDYRDHSRSQEVMAEALEDAYSDIFLITSKPTAADKTAIQGKFKSFHNASDNVASMMASTFLKLVELADFDAVRADKIQQADGPAETVQYPQSDYQKEVRSNFSGLHYNIQIHLPATKDLEVYNAIFRSLKEHLID